MGSCDYLATPILGDAGQSIRGRGKVVTAEFSSPIFFTAVSTFPPQHFILLRDIGTESKVSGPRTIIQGDNNIIGIQRSNICLLV